MYSKTNNTSVPPSSVFPPDAAPGHAQVSAVGSELTTDSIFAPRVFLDIYLGHDRDSPKISSLYDTGAVCSLMSAKDFELCTQAGCVVGEVEPERAFRLKGASQRNIESIGVFSIKFVALGRLCDAPFIVSPAVSPTLLGMNVITPFGIHLNPVTMELSLLAPRHLAQTAEVGAVSGPTQHDWRVFLKDETTIEPRTGQLVKCVVKDGQTGERLEGTYQILVNCEIFSVACTTEGAGIVSFHLPNADTTPIHLPRGTVIGTAESLTDWVPINSANSQVDMANAGIAATS